MLAETRRCSFVFWDWTIGRLGLGFESAFVPVVEPLFEIFCFTNSSINISTKACSRLHGPKFVQSATVGIVSESVAYMTVPKMSSKTSVSADRCTVRHLLAPKLN